MRSPSCEELGTNVCNDIRQHLPQFQAPNNFAAFSSNCMAFKGEVWPFAHGAPVKIIDDYVCIDMWAASMGFLAWLQFPRIQGFKDSRPGSERASD